MLKVWKIIKPTKKKSIKDEIKSLKKNGVILSPWIENIFFNKKNKIKLTKKKITLYKITVKSLGFKKADTLEKI